MIASTVGAALLADLTEGLLNRGGIPLWSRLGHHVTIWRVGTANP